MTAQHRNCSPSISLLPFGHIKYTVTSEYVTFEYVFAFFVPDEMSDKTR